MIGRILIVEDEAPWQERLAKDLEAEGYKVYIAASLEDARQLLNQGKPDVVTLDMTLSVYGRKRKQGYALLEELDMMPNSPEVIIVSGTISREEVKTIWQGYDIFDVLLKKNYSRQYFIQTVRDAIEAKRHADTEEENAEEEDEPLTDSNADEHHPPTEKELADLREVARGKTNKEIAANLGKSVNTVKKQLSTVSKKLGTTGRINAVNKARELGYIPREE